MIDLSLFTDKEAVELILGFYTFTLGFWVDELDRIPEAKKFVDLGLTCPDEDYPELKKPNEQGYELLHEYIKKMSDDFIKNIETNGIEQKQDDVNKWFLDNLKLNTIEDAEDIASYICGNLYHYGYKTHKCNSLRKGKFYWFEKI